MIPTALGTEVAEAGDLEGRQDQAEAVAAEILRKLPRGQVTHAASRAKRTNLMRFQSS